MKVRIWCFQNGRIPNFMLVPTLVGLKWRIRECLSRFTQCTPYPIRSGLGCSHTVVAKRLQARQRGVCFVVFIETRFGLNRRHFVKMQGFIYLFIQSVNGCIFVVFLEQHLSTQGRFSIKLKGGVAFITLSFHPQYRDF